MLFDTIKHLKENMEETSSTVIFRMTPKVKPMIEKINN